jgi:hypothetical protein
MPRYLAMLLGAGWLVLTAPEGKPPTTPLAEWSRGKDYGTAYECEQGRRTAVRAWLEKTGASPFDAEWRFRCVRVEQLPR